MRKHRLTVYNSVEMRQIKGFVRPYGCSPTGREAGKFGAAGRQLSILCGIILAFTQALAIDNLHFYRANFWWGEPRFERPWLTTFDAGIAGGSTSKARDANGNLVSLHGEFSLNEATFDFRQNFDKGLFTQIYLPVRSFRLRHMRLEGFKKTGPGDLTAGLGWTINYQNTKYLDFIDGTVKLSALFPTGLQAHGGGMFNLPTGYNGHWGISADADASIGLWEWLTMGGNLGALWLLPKNSVTPGTYIHVGCYLKGDHFNEIFSLALGYSYNLKGSDRESRSWTMHTFHVFAEFDFAKRGRRWHPRVNILYNTPLAGKRIFNMAMGGASLGIDVTWQID